MLCKWSQEKILELIEKVKERTEIWDTSTDGYKNRRTRLKALEDVAESMNLHPHEIRHKYSMLRSSLRREMIRMRKNSAYTPSWAYYEPLSFLQVQMQFDSKATRFYDNDNEIREFLRKVDPDDSPNEEDTDMENYDESPEMDIINNSPIKIKRELEHEQNANDTTAIKKQKQIRNDRTVILTNNKGPTILKDDYDIFGAYVASELRSLTSERSRRKLKQLIREAIITVTRDDEI